MALHATTDNVNINLVVPPWKSVTTLFVQMKTKYLQLPSMMFSRIHYQIVDQRLMAQVNKLI